MQTHEVEVLKKPVGIEDLEALIDRFKPNDMNKSLKRFVVIQVHPIVKLDSY